MTTKLETHKVYFRIEGRFVANLARNLWAEGAYVKALRMLMTGLSGMTYDSALSILTGRATLDGWDSDIRLVKDNVKTDNRGLPLLTLEQAFEKMQAQLDEKDKELKETRHPIETTANLIKAGARIVGFNAFEEGLRWQAVQEIELGTPKPDKKLLSAHGYLLPSGKLYGCPYYGHIKLADALGKTQAEVERDGWIKLQNGHWWENSTTEPTREQVGTIMDWCKQHGVQPPDWMGPKE